jgi:hypothetical protein
MRITPTPSSFDGEGLSTRLFIWRVIKMGARTADHAHGAPIVARAQTLVETGVMVHEILAAARSALQSQRQSARNISPLALTLPVPRSGMGVSPCTIGIHDEHYGIISNPHVFSCVFGQRLCHFDGRGTQESDGISRAPVLSGGI